MVKLPEKSLWKITGMKGVTICGAPDGVSFAEQLLVRKTIAARVLATGMNKHPLPSSPKPGTAEGKARINENEGCIVIIKRGNAGAGFPKGSENPFYETPLNR